MKEVFSSEKVEALRMTVAKEIALSAHEHIDYALQTVRRNMCLELADKITTHEKFFTHEVIKSARFEYLNIRANVIVLTEQEYGDLCRVQFRKGLDHAFGYMPTSDPSVIGR